MTETGGEIGMFYIIVFFVCFLASVAGAICGIGGGVIIKPALDALGIMSVSAVSFLSGCTVLSMTAYSVLKGKLNGKSNIEQKTGLPLALGAAFGGIAGKWMFSSLSAISPDKDRVGAIQAICLFAVTLGSLLFTIYKEKIKTCRVTSPAVCVFIGIVLGIMSSFLGIGGGPINLVVLFYFFSMPTKTAAENSLYIIFFSQITSLISSIVTKSVPEFHFFMLILMAAGGIGGGIVGRMVNKKLTDKLVNRLFIILMVLILFINVYNIYRFIS